MPRGRKSILSRFDVQYCCEWKECRNKYSDEAHLKIHILEHFKTIYALALEKQINPICGICDTVLILDDIDAIERHSHFHAWVFCLRAKGEQMQKIHDWPKCLSDSSSRNSIPELPTKFECGWEYCEFKTNDIAVFINHVSKHPEEYTDSRYPEGTQLRCLWENCSYVGSRLRNLILHLDTHTQTKKASCPTCGLLLVDYRKMEDHLTRQQIHLLNSNVSEPEQQQQPHGQKLHPSIRPMKCTRCQRVFSTQRLLDAHMKRHINTVKCPFCDMTAWAKSALDRHILFRHTTERPYTCSQCSYSCKVVSGLNRHIRLRHGQSEDHPTGESTDSGTTLVRGPLAAAGALSLASDNTNLLSIQSPIRPNLQLLANRNATPNRLNPNKPQWIMCPHSNCRFRTTKQSGFMIHLGRKHIDLTLARNDNSVTDTGKFTNDTVTPSVAITPMGTTPTTAVPTATNYELSDSFTETTSMVPRLYMCHLCPVVKRRGGDLSKHLMKIHNLARPSGHVRFTYTISDDGHYRLQLTRLDTIPVAAQLLGETVVNKLLIDTQEKIPVNDGS